MQERLQKIISRAGVASRRKAEELITQGLVSVNGKTVTELGAKADPAKDSVKVRGKRINQAPPKPIYLMLNKPKGYVTTMEDPEGRRTVTDLLGRYRKSVYPIGRLDYSSEGLLFLTNDGDLTNRLTAARYGVPKTYQVKVNGSLNVEQLDRFRSGIKLDGRMTAPAKIRLIRAAANPWYEVVLHEGRNRQIRRMFQRLGPLVEKIRRVKVGPVSLRGVEIGTVRPLTDYELERLLKAVQLRPVADR